KEIAAELTTDKRPADAGRTSSIDDSQRFHCEGSITMTLRTRGGTALRTVGVAITVAGLGLLSFGTLTARASEQNNGPSLSSTPDSDVVSDGWSLTDKIVLTGGPPENPGTPDVTLLKGNCLKVDGVDVANPDNTVVADDIASTVKAGDDSTWIASTDGVHVEKSGDYSFQTSWKVGQGEGAQILTLCDNLDV